jgi:hypothetical protein
MAHPNSSRLNTIVTIVVSSVMPPWNAFIAAFLYYTLLTLIAIGVADLAAGFVAVAYLLPVALYAGLLITRGVHALAALPIDIGETPHALMR